MSSPRFAETISEEDRVAIQEALLSAPTWCDRGEPLGMEPFMVVTERLSPVATWRFGEVPDDVDFTAIFAAAQATRRFWMDHRAEFLALYPEMHVAARQGEVVAFNAALAALEDELRRRGIGPGAGVSIEFITANRPVFIL